MLARVGFGCWLCLPVWQGLLHTQLGRVISGPVTWMAVLPQGSLPKKQVQLDNAQKNSEVLCWPADEDLSALQARPKGEHAALLYDCLGLAETSGNARESAGLMHAQRWR